VIKIVVIKRIGVLSFSKMYALTMGIFGFIFGILIALLSLAESISEDPLLSMGIVAIVVLPLLYGLIGFVGGAFSAWLYNILAKWIGGVEIEFDAKELKAKSK